MSHTLPIILPTPPITLSPAIHSALTAFATSPEQFAIILGLRGNTDSTTDPPKHLALHPPPITTPPHTSFQTKLDVLSRSLSLKSSCYVILRRDRGEGLVFVTYVPYLDAAATQDFFLTQRRNVVAMLVAILDRGEGEEGIGVSLVCKEVGEVVDARAWVERDMKQGDKKHSAVKDFGYKKTKCRLCDRRMKMDVTEEALLAMDLVKMPGTAVVISLSLTPISTAPKLILTSTHPSTSPSLLPSLLSRNTNQPCFIFYSHPRTLVTWLVSFCPDTAAPRVRMAHVLALPGLVSVDARGRGVGVRRTVEVSEVGELEDVVTMEEEEEEEEEGGCEGEEGKGKGEAGRESGVRKYRSMWGSGEWEGTEMQYRNLQADGAFWDAVVG